MLHRDEGESIYVRATQKNGTAIYAFTGFLLLFFCALLSPAQEPGPAAASDGWGAYGGDPGGLRFSSASQIARKNVSQLKAVWTFHTGALQQETKLIRKAAFETTPILFENKLFLTTPYDKVFALDPGNGEKLWEFDPHVDLTRNYSEVTSRGVSAWRDSNAKP